MTSIDDLPFSLETPLEHQIAADPDWRLGLEFGEPRPGHPEGAVKWHVADVLANVDRFYGDSPLRESLRLIALVHDTFKHEVDESRARSGENHHAMRARRFAERHVADAALLDIIELHDEAYNAWQKGHRDRRWDKAEERAARLIARLGSSLELYLAFFACDNATGDKRPDSLMWFRDYSDRSATAGGDLV